MVKPLDGAKLKIIRAQEHLDSFKTEERAFLDTRPYSILSETYLDYWYLRPVINANPSRSMSLIIGDCLTNSRAALDYIIWQLAVAYFSPKADITDTNDRKITAFPICEPRRAPKPWYTNRINALTNRRVPADAIQEIKAVQPDASGNDALWWLHEFVNHDKHRMPLLTVARFDTTEIKINNWRGVDWFVTSDQNTVADGIAIQAEHGLPRGMLADIRKQQVDVNLQATLHITCEDSAMPRVPLTIALEQIIKTVADIIPRFERFF